MAEAPVVDDFEVAFAEAAKAVETTGELPEVKLVEKPAATPAEVDKADAAKAGEEAAKAEEAAAAAAKADAEKNAEKNAEIKAAEDAAKAAADKKAAEDKAAAGGETKTAEQIAAEEAAAKKAAEDKAAADALAKTALEKPAPAKTAEQLAEEQRQETARVEAEEKSKKEIAAALADYELTPEEKTAMEKWKKDFPEESVAIEARLKQIDRMVTQRVYNGVSAVLQQVYREFTPVMQKAEVLTEREHHQAVKAVHADYDPEAGYVVTELPEWIKKQPAYLQSAYQTAYDGGDAQAVIDLIARFKESTGRKANGPAGGAPATGTQPAPAKPAASKEEVDALAPVGVKRSTPAAKGGPDPMDFDGAFEEATAGSK